jgi:hypothetical protein
LHRGEGEVQKQNTDIDMNNTTSDTTNDNLSNMAAEPGNVPPSGPPRAIAADAHMAPVSAGRRRAGTATPRNEPDAASPLAKRVVHYQRIDPANVSQASGAMSADQMTRGINSLNAQAEADRVWFDTVTDTLREHAQAIDHNKVRSMATHVRGAPRLSS